MPVIEVRNVSYAYNGFKVLDNVNLTVDENEYIAIIGPNGGGKTTLLKLILGLLKPLNGKIKVFGKEPKKVTKHIGYVPQQINYKFGFPVSVLDVVLMGYSPNLGFKFSYSSKEKKSAYKVLEYVDMLSFANKKISELSGGQAQRVFLARALVSNPKLLILDEPTSSIDPHGTFCFYTFLEELSKSITIMVVSHNLNLVASNIASVACVNRKLIYSKNSELTEEMMSLMYGTHDEHNCSVGIYLAEEAKHMNKHMANKQ